ncbi:cytochrome b561 domain-containing protein [Senna tora]|uniref:Cytochrome b561 domain-containing protein n=1 Tax=Senna tora TaxID=362788 RepID=A0A834T4V8_9FABA|nr:cytochrome b561 domain-containing protein [Senna tora]
MFQASLASIMLPLVICSSQRHQKNNLLMSSLFFFFSFWVKMNPKLEFEITVHGFLLWASMGFLMPIGIIAIRLSNSEKNQRRLKHIFYVHAFLQNFAVLLATAGAIMSIKNFNNSFNNNHQRVGVALYAIIWLQLLLGIIRPQRGSKRRSVWFFSHWIIGTAVSFLGVLSVYSGLEAYKNILFTAQVTFILFFYLFQDKWSYIQNQGLVLDNEPRNPTSQEICGDDKKQKELKAESC